MVYMLCSAQLCIGENKIYLHLIKVTFCENELVTLLQGNRKTSSPSDSALHLLSHLLQPDSLTQTHNHADTHTQTHTQWRYVLGALSEQHWILSLLRVCYSSGTYPEPRTVFLTHSSFYDHSWQCTLSPGHWRSDQFHCNRYTNTAVTLLCQESTMFPFRTALDRLNI